MRHAITKLAHVHFPATPGSAERLRKLGEDDWRIHQVGTPGIDGIFDALADRLPDDPPRDEFALIVLHPTRDNAEAEYATADRLLAAVRQAGLRRVEIVMPNNDLGRSGIARRWDKARQDEGVRVHDNLARPRFLRLMADAKVLAGNSSSGIIEAASFDTPVLDLGARQAGRERSANVVQVEEDDLASGLQLALQRGRTQTSNVYGGDGTGRRIADALANLDAERYIHQKLIVY